MSNSQLGGVSLNLDSEIRKGPQTLANRELGNCCPTNDSTRPRDRFPQTRSLERDNSSTALSEGAYDLQGDHGCDIGEGPLDYQR